MTKYEKAIYKCIIDCSGAHLTAEQVFNELKKVYPSISLATIYNNLNKLCQAGLIRKIAVEGSPDRYDRIEKHDHLVCADCGDLKDAHFGDITESLRKQLGEDILFYDLKVYYLCPECRREMEEWEFIQRKDPERR